MNVYVLNIYERYEINKSILSLLGMWIGADHCLDTPMSRVIQEAHVAFGIRFFLELRGFRRLTLTQVVLDGGRGIDLSGILRGVPAQEGESCHCSLGSSARLAIV